MRTYAALLSAVCLLSTATLPGSTKDLRANFVLIDDLGSDELPLRSVNLR